ncbi:MAG TPA: hypothetical protein VIH76_12470 [Candidatus Acidoferrales bacterium]
MNRMNPCRLLSGGRFSALVALIALVLLLTASGAKAGGCGVSTSKGAAATLAPFVGPHGSNLQLGEDFLDHTIVGLWHVNYTAEAESGAPIFPPAPFAFLESFKTWHADGTEFENAFLAPSGGNICFGVWKEVGRGQVKLHHIGLMFDATTGAISNTFTVDEKDTVGSNGQTYTGSFDFKLWPPSFAAVGVGAPIAEVTGTISATRITVD